MAEPKTAKHAPSKSEGKPRRKKKTAAEPRSRGSVLAPYKDPLGGHWQIFAALPIDLVEPTPYQRDLSQPRVERLAAAMDKLGRYLDPMIVVRGERRRRRWQEVSGERSGSAPMAPR